MLRKWIRLQGWIQRWKSVAGVLLFLVTMAAVALPIKLWEINRVAFWVYTTIAAGLYALVYANIELEGEFEGLAGKLIITFLKIAWPLTIARVLLERGTKLTLKVGGVEAKELKN